MKKDSSFFCLFIFCLNYLFSVFYSSNLLGYYYDILIFLILLLHLLLECDFKKFLPQVKSAFNQQNFVLSYFLENLKTYQFTYNLNYFDLF